MQYAWAGKLAYKKNIIEVGCGEGYGAQILSLFATSYLGIDISPTFLKRAKNKQMFCPANFEIADVDVPLNNFGVLQNTLFIAFETLEHIKYPKDLVRSLAEAGLPLLFSVPHNYPHSLHITDYYCLDDVKELAGAYKSTQFWYMKDGQITEQPVDNPDRYIGYCQP